MDPVIITVSFEQRRKMLAGLNESTVRFALDAAGSFWFKAYPWIVYRPLMTPDVPKDLLRRHDVTSTSSAEETSHPAR